VAVLTLNRPQRRNALTSPLLLALGRCLRHIAADSQIGALLLGGAGEAFCAGGDIEELLARDLAQPAAEQASAFERRVQRIQQLQRETALALHALAIPTVAVLPGAAAGAGLALALACDLRIASERALLVTAYAQLGLSGDFGASWFLARLVGPARAKELCFLSPRLDAASAERLGLLNRVVAHSALPAEALALARSLASGPRLALRYMKENLNRALGTELAPYLDEEAVSMARTLQSGDHREGVAAFLEKRPPRFQGR
jgi:2-(1,2-epoxy-1,2-dihydrophenyl)acetyl-CoA isomerase